MRFTTLADWLDWQTGLSPKHIDLGLERVRAVWERLAIDTLGAAVITVGGTNGKGSSVAFAEAILQAAGYRTGCYTSPHLVRYNERIRVDQVEADDRRICAAFERVDRARGEIPLTYFEFGTLAALCIFSEQPLDAVILEVGLGGRLDAVNLIDPDVALISSIGLDHQDWLGNDLESIAREKAGIMRSGRPVVFSGRAMPASIRSSAAAVGARLLVAGEDYHATRHADSWDLSGAGVERRSLPLPGLRGAVQFDNAAGVIVALAQLATRLPLDQRAVRAGLLTARLRGRFEVRPGRPTWVLDVAHNPQAAGVLDGMLADLHVPGRRIAVCGMLADKDAAGVAQVLAARFDAWYLIDLDDRSRGLSAAALYDRMRPALPGVELHRGGEIGDTLATLSGQLAADDQVVVFGSFLTVGAAMHWMETARGSADG